MRAFGVASLQELPTAGLRRFGVPVGGAFDQESLALALGLSSTSLNEAWELGMAQATFIAESAGVVGVAGAVAQIRLGSATFDSSVGFSVTPGDEFTVDVPTVGARVYVAFGSVLRPSGWRRRLEDAPDSVTNRNVLRVTPGPQANLFDMDVLSQPFEVSRTGNRVGIRLGPSIGPHPIELPSEPACVGTIQIANDGTPILLGPDGPTIGGYPKIAVVASADIPRIAQLQPGEPVRFELVTIMEARAMTIEAQDRLRKRIQMLKLAG